MRAIERLREPAAVAQATSIVTSLGLLSVITNLYPATAYASYIGLAAVWAIGNAVVGTGIGTRIAREAAKGSTVVRLSVAEVMGCVIAAAVSAGYGHASGLSVLDVSIGSLTMITFVLAEANCTFQLGHRRLWRFAVLVLIRTATPVVAALVFATFSANTLTAVIGSIALGNIACLFVFPNSWSIRARAEGISSLDVGIVNFGLWVIASADRMILQLTAEPHVLAVYALSYGLVDRACRSLSNVYISKSIGLPDGGASASKGRVLTLISGVLAIGLVPAVIIGSFVVSGGKYVPDFALGASVSVAGVLMFASAPFYVRMLASGRIRMPAVVVLSIAVLNVALNSLCARSGSVLPAAWISGGSYAIWTVYLAVRFRRRGRHVAVPEVRRSIARIEQRQSS